jgi:hypothetical protein
MSRRSQQCDRFQAPYRVEGGATLAAPAAFWFRARNSSRIESSFEFVRACCSFSPDMASVSAWYLVTLLLLLGVVETAGK